jgi:hypothetical protein
VTPVDAQSAEEWSQTMPKAMGMSPMAFRTWPMVRLAGLDGVDDATGRVFNRRQQMVSVRSSRR